VAQREESTTSIVGLGRQRRADAAGMAAPAHYG
jgi:hypothetical protein